MLFIA